MDLARRILERDRLALARGISLIEDRADSAQELLASLYPCTGKAHTVGVTGAPGSGKSTLVNELAKAYRRRQARVGIIAVDPTSPFTGGAILGDRVRMRDLSGDPDVFIRSMASRGSLGGLAHATGDAIKVLDAAGFDKIIVETVGAGQAEVDIAQEAHTTIVLQVPDLGDDIQSMKAGLLEIADIMVVNKADREGAERTAAILEAMVGLAERGVPHGAGHRPEPIAELVSEGKAWRPAILKTVATRGEGITALVEAIEEHGRFLDRSGRRRRGEHERALRELRYWIQEMLWQSFAERLSVADLDVVVHRIVNRELDPRTAALHVLEQARQPAGAGEDR